MLRIVSPNKNRIRSLMKDIGVDKYGVDIMGPKADQFLVKTGKISTVEANIIKQTLLSLGADAAVAKWSITGSRKPTDCLIVANESQLLKLVFRLKNQPFGLNQIADDLQAAIENFHLSSYNLKAGKFNLSLGKKTKLMAIVNATPDSFSQDGLLKTRRIFNEAQIQDLLITLKSKGADIIDIGGESSRPGAKAVSAKTELARILPFLEHCPENLNIPISIDTYKVDVAKAALENGASIINDIYGLRFNKKLAKLIAKKKAAVIIMHMRGNPETMQKKARYKFLIDEIIAFFEESIKIAYDAGIKKESIVLDPGIGFGKLLEHNLEIINNLEELKSLGFPILIGVSRKSFIGKILNKAACERLMGTAGSVALSVSHGADIVRVHDVEAMKDVIKVSDAIRNG